MRELLESARSCAGVGVENIDELLPLAAQVVFVHALLLVRGLGFSFHGSKVFIMGLRCQPVVFA